MQTPGGLSCVKACKFLMVKSKWANSWSVENPESYIVPQMHSYKLFNLKASICWLCLSTPQRFFKKGPFKDYALVLLVFTRIIILDSQIRIEDHKSYIKMYI